MNIIDKLTKIVESPRLRPSSKNFVESLLGQSIKSPLSPKQKEYVEKFWEECFPAQEVLDKEQAWKDSFTEEMKENVRIMGKYYEVNYPNSRMARGYKVDGWVPSAEIYEKSVLTDWAKSCIANYKKDYKFSVGEMVVFRDTSINRSEHRHQMGSSLLVLEQEKSAAHSFKSYYKVIEFHKMEDQRTLLVSEDVINFDKKAKKKV